MLIAIGSLKGSPGVTTSAVALAAMWPAGATTPMLLEADPAGGDLAARFQTAPAPGLLTLSAAARHEHDVALLARHALELPGGLPVIAAPPGEAGASVALLGRDGLGLLRAAAADPDLVLVADVGRITSESVAWPIALAADQLLVVVRPVLSELSRVITASEQLLERCAAAGTRLGLVTVGTGPFPTSEIEVATGIEVSAQLPDDQVAAAVLGGMPDPRGKVARLAAKGRGGPIASLPLARAACALATALRRPAPEPDADGHKDLDSIQTGAGR
jgi:hypothetical protein